MRGPEKDRAALEDMLRYARRARRHSAAGRQAFDDDLTRDGILFELAIVGEAANRLSNELRSTHPEVPWRRIIDQRNILVHVYDQLNVDRVWETVEAIPGLERQIEEILEELGEP